MLGTWSPNSRQNLKENCYECCMFQTNYSLDCSLCHKTDLDLRLTSKLPEDKGSQRASTFLLFSVLMFQHWSQTVLTDCEQDPWEWHPSRFVQLKAEHTGRIEVWKMWPTLSDKAFCRHKSPLILTCCFFFHPHPTDAGNALFWEGSEDDFWCVHDPDGTERDVTVFR